MRSTWTSTPKGRQFLAFRYGGIPAEKLPDFRAAFRRWGPILVIAGVLLIGVGALCLEVGAEDRSRHFWEQQSAGSLAGWAFLCWTSGLLCLVCGLVAIVRARLYLEPSRDDIAAAIAEYRSECAARATPKKRQPAIPLPPATFEPPPVAAPALPTIKKRTAEEPHRSAPASGAPIKGWERITGTAAIQLAERANAARPGTFSAAAIQWTADGKAPLSVKITGTIQCGYCGGSNAFSLSAMTGRESCPGCGATYSLFNTDTMIDGKDGRVIIASVYSHREGTAIILPQIDIGAVAADEICPPVEQTTAPRVLSVWDCGDRNKVKAFIDEGGDINARDEDQFTALHRAATMDQAEYVRNLLEFGADPNLPVLPGTSKRTAEVVRNNRRPNAVQIEAMLSKGGR